MRLKKSIFSYLIWILFAVVCGLEMAFCLLKLFPLNWGIGGLVLEVLVWALLTVLVFYVLRRMCNAFRRKRKDAEKREGLVFILLPFLILAGVIVYFIYYVVQNAPIILEDDSFYRAAYVVSGGQNMPFVTHGASFLYTRLLHGIFLLFGNVPFAGVVAQIVCFAFCLLFLYIGIRAFSDSISAAVSMAAFAFLPASLAVVFSLTPEVFYLTAYLLGFCLLGIALQNYRKRGRISLAGYILLFLLGCYIGFLLYLDIFSISLLFFAAAFYSLEILPKSYWAPPVIWLGCAGGFALSVIVLILTGKTTVDSFLTEYFTVAFRHFHFMAWESYPDITLAGSLILLTLAFFCVSAFLHEKNYQYSAFILSLLLILALPVFTQPALSGQPLASLIWCMLAGLGVHGILRPEEMEKEEEKDSIEQEKVNKEAVKSPKVISEDEKKEKTDKSVEEKAVLENIAIEKTDSGKVISEKKEMKKPAPGEPLPNPLPVPVRKKKNKIDFDYEIEEEDMKFDLDISGNDDFDH